ncbi:nitrosoguanidine resistance protein [Colletotrichum truncatum]|uniref:Nitrosoguanidine resistance protein n=1 Tax=Colletotrichum truncatum TaxID=5467 RepID=A0ACC3YE38_COLTU|nr:nitrosoguanidine resistance protein [Colletotrichum truncatum]KAF6790212.1 nitrosoguanidine resistance protein [Colletotrichum truncatum]
MEAQHRQRLRQWEPLKQTYATPVLLASISLLLMVLANMCYLSGTTHNQQQRTSALNILFLDLDGGPVGSSIWQASGDLQSPSFPTVKKGHDGISEWFAGKLNGTVAAQAEIPLVTYSYNQAKFPAISDGLLQGNILKIINSSRNKYLSAMGAQNLTGFSGEAVFTTSIQAAADLIQVTPQGARVLYNTVNMIIPTLGQFFFMLALNIIGQFSGFLSQVRVRDVWVLRFVCGKLYTILISLVVPGYIWAFRGEWPVGSQEFGKTFLAYLLYMDTQWQFLDTFTGSFVSMPFMPHFLLTWIILNVSSTIFPFELMPGWYRIGWAMPAHSIYALLISAWSGCGQDLHIVLPVLFAWWVVGHVTAVFSIRKRCRDAAKMAA